MKLTLSVPRSRPAHLASIPAPEDFESPLLELTGPNQRLIAERDPSSAIYHLNLPAIGLFSDKLVMHLTFRRHINQHIGAYFCLTR